MPKDTTGLYTCALCTRRWRDVHEILHVFVYGSIECEFCVQQNEGGWVEHFAFEEGK